MTGCRLSSPFSSSHTRRFPKMSLFSRVAPPPTRHGGAVTNTKEGGPRDPTSALPSDAHACRRRNRVLILDVGRVAGPNRTSGQVGHPALLINGKFG